MVFREVPLLSPDDVKYWTARDVPAPLPHDEGIHFDSRAIDYAVRGTIGGGAFYSVGHGSREYRNRYLSFTASGDTVKLIEASLDKNTEEYGHRLRFPAPILCDSVRVFDDPQGRQIGLCAVTLGGIVYRLWFPYGSEQHTSQGGEGAVSSLFTESNVNSTIIASFRLQDLSDTAIPTCCVWLDASNVFIGLTSGGIVGVRFFSSTSGQEVRADQVLLQEKSPVLRFWSGVKGGGVEPSQSAITSIDAVSARSGEVLCFTATADCKIRIWSTTLRACIFTKSYVVEAGGVRALTGANSTNSTIVRAIWRHSDDLSQVMYVFLYIPGTTDIMVYKGIHADQECKLTFVRRLVLPLSTEFHTPDQKARASLCDIQIGESSVWSLWRSAAAEQDSNASGDVERSPNLAAVASFVIDYPSVFAREQATEIVGRIHISLHGEYERQFVEDEQYVQALQTSAQKILFTYGEEANISQVTDRLFQHYLDRLLMPFRYSKSTLLRAARHWAGDSDIPTQTTEVSRRQLESIIYECIQSQIRDASDVEDIIRICSEFVSICTAIWIKETSPCAFITGNNSISPAPLVVRSRSVSLLWPVNPLENDYWEFVLDGSIKDDSELVSTLSDRFPSSRDANVLTSDISTLLTLAVRTSKALGDAIEGQVDGALRSLWEPSGGAVATSQSIISEVEAIVEDRQLVKVEDLTRSLLEITAFFGNMKDEEKRDLFERLVILIAPINLDYNQVDETVSPTDAEEWCKGFLQSESFGNSCVASLQASLRSRNLLARDILLMCLQLVGSTNPAVMSASLSRHLKDYVIPKLVGSLKAIGLARWATTIRGLDTSPVSLGAGGLADLSNLNLDERVAGTQQSVTAIPPGTEDAQSILSLLHAVNSKTLQKRMIARGEIEQLMLGSSVDVDATLGVRIKTLADVQQTLVNLVWKSSDCTTKRLSSVAQYLKNHGQYQHLQHICLTVVNDAVEYDEIEGHLVLRGTSTLDASRHRTSSTTPDNSLTRSGQIIRELLPGLSKNVRRFYVEALAECNIYRATVVPANAPNSQQLRESYAEKALELYLQAAPVSTEWASARTRSRNGSDQMQDERDDTVVQQRQLTHEEVDYYLRTLESIRQGALSRLCGPRVVLRMARAVLGILKLAIQQNLRKHGGRGGEENGSSVFSDTSRPPSAKEDELLKRYIREERKVYVTIFKSCIELGQFEEAYVAMASNTDPEKRMVRLVYCYMLKAGRDYLS